MNFNVTAHTYQELQAWSNDAQAQGDFDRWQYFQHLIATASGRYYISRPNLNELVNQSEDVEVIPTSFRDWLSQIWAQVS